MSFLSDFEGRISSVFESAPQGYAEPFSFKKLAKHAARKMESETYRIDGVDTAPALYTVLVSAEDDSLMRPLYERIGGTALLSNVVTRPDFVAYRFSDRDNPAVRLSCDVLGGHLVVWTVRSEQDLRAAEAAGAVVIFEGFLPE